MPLIKLNAQSATALDATKLTGNLPAISGASLTGIASDFVKLHSTTLSSAASTVSIDGHFSSTYDIYKIIVFNYENETDDVAAFFRVNVSGSAQSSAIYISTGNSVKTTTGNSITGSDFGTYSAYNQQYFSWVQAQNTGTNLSRLCSEITIFNPLGTTSFKDIHYKCTYEGNQQPLFTENVGMKVATTSAITGLTFLASSGNIETGTFTLYGVKK